MQKKLREISSIPFLIQSTIAQVTQALEKFCPPEPEPEPEPEPQDVEPQEMEKVDLEAIAEEDEEDEEIEKEESVEDLEPALESLALELLFDESASLDEKLDAGGIVEELTAELLEEERIRQAKLQKIAKLDRSWPWNSGFEKKIYKRSNCYLVPGSRSSRIQEKIKQLNVDELFAMHANRMEN